VDEAQPHMSLLGLEADLEIALWASNIPKKGPIRLMGGGAYTMDAAQPHMAILGLEAGLERALLASNISTKGPSDWWAGAHTPRMQLSPAQQPSTL
jgi:hypothetical protein